MKNKYSLNPKEFDIGGTETYYSRMAEKGWKLVKRGSVFSKFEKSNPEKIKYRIEIVSPKLLNEGNLPEEQIAVYEDCGWEYVTGNRFHHIFRAHEESDSPEFYTEPSQQAETLKALRKNYIFDALSPLFYVILFTLLSFLSWNVTDGHWFAAFYKSWITDTYLNIGWLLVLAGLVFNDIWGTVYLSRLYHKMKKEIPINHNKNSSHYFLRISQNIILISGIVCLLYGFFSSRTLPLPDETDEPYILMDEIGIGGERTENMMSEKSEVRHNKSLLSESWYVREFKENTQYMYQEVYILRNQKSMDRFAESLMYNSTFARSPDNFIKIEIPGLDQAWITEHLECIAVKGRIVIIMTHMWNSTEDMKESLKILSQKWENQADCNRSGE